MCHCCDSVASREGRQCDAADPSFVWQNPSSATTGAGGGGGEPRASTTTPGPPSSSPPLRGRKKRPGGGESLPTSRAGMSVVAFSEYPDRLLCDPSNSLWLYAVFEYKYGFTEEMCREQMYKLIQKMNRIAAHHFEASVKLFQRLPVGVQHFQILRTMPLGMAANSLVLTPPEKWADHLRMIRIKKNKSGSNSKTGNDPFPCSTRSLWGPREGVEGGVGGTIAGSSTPGGVSHLPQHSSSSSSSSSSTSLPSPSSSSRHCQHLLHPHSYSKHKARTSVHYSRSFSSPSTTASAMLLQECTSTAASPFSISSITTKRNSTVGPPSPGKSDERRTTSPGGGRGGSSISAMQYAVGGNTMVPSAKGNASGLIHILSRGSQELQIGEKKTKVVGGRGGGENRARKLSILTSIEPSKSVVGAVVTGSGPSSPQGTAARVGDPHNGGGGGVSTSHSTSAAANKEGGKGGETELEGGRTLNTAASSVFPGQSNGETIVPEGEDDVEETLRQLQPLPLRVPEEMAVQYLSIQWPSLVGLTELEEQLLQLQEHALLQQQAGGAGGGGGLPSFSSLSPSSTHPHRSFQRSQAHTSVTGAVGGGGAGMGVSPSPSTHPGRSPRISDGGGSSWYKKKTGLGKSGKGESTDRGASSATSRAHDLLPSPAKHSPGRNQRKETESSLFSSSASPATPPRPLAQPKINVVLDIVASRKTLTADPHTSAPYKLGQWVYKYYHSVGLQASGSERRMMMSAGSSLLQDESSRESLLPSSQPATTFPKDGGSGTGGEPQIQPMGRKVAGMRGQAESGVGEGGGGAISSRPLSTPIRTSRLKSTSMGTSSSGLLQRDMATALPTALLPSYSLSPSCSQLFVGISDSSVKMVGRDILFPYKVIPYSSHLANVSQRFSLLHTPSQILLHSLGLSPLPAPHPSMLPLLGTSTTINTSPPLASAASSSPILVGGGGSGGGGGGATTRHRCSSASCSSSSPPLSQQQQHLPPPPHLLHSESTGPLGGSNVAAAAGGGGLSLGGGGLSSTMSKSSLRRSQGASGGGSGGMNNFSTTCNHPDSSLALGISTTGNGMGTSSTFGGGGGGVGGSLWNTANGPVHPSTTSPLLVGHSSVNLGGTFTSSSLGGGGASNTGVPSNTTTTTGGGGSTFLFQPNSGLPICLRQPPMYLDSIDQKRFIICHPARYV